MDERRRHGPGDVLLAGEAWVLLGVMRAMLLVVPFKRMMGALRMRVSAPDAVAAPAQGDPVVPDGSARLDRVRWSIDAAARRTPWESKCFAQSLAGSLMLRLRGEPSMVFLGVRPASVAEDRPMTAHSWLVSRGRIVTGEAGHRDYAVVAVYGSPAAARIRSD